MGAATGKAFLPLAGIPLVAYALNTLTTVPRVTCGILVVARDAVGQARTFIAQHGPWRVPIALTTGGDERQDSVAAGVACVDDAADFIIVHDAARPFVTATCVDACLDVAERDGAAIVATPTRDTVKLVDNGRITRTLDRQTVWLAQTPQIFRTALLRRALATAQRDGYVATDDAALVEHLGETVSIVPGEPTNLKITTPDDLQWAEHYLSVRNEPRPPSSPRKAGP